MLARGAQDLQVHPAIPDGAAEDAPFLTDYARRGHDRELGRRVKDAVGGRSTMVVLVGGSSTGKTRACWEALRELDPLTEGQGWRMWRPPNAKDLLSALSSPTVDLAHTVVWLDELQTYLHTKSETSDEATAAAMQRLLDDPDRQPVLVLGTIWPERWNALVRRPAQSEEDRRPLTRRLVQHCGLSVPEVAEGEDVQALREAARRDGRVAVALERDPRHPIQYLAGARELLRRYEQAPAPLRAVLEAVADARRVGVPQPFTEEFVEQAAQDYLEQRDLLRLPAVDRGKWVERALAELQVPSRGVPGPLSPVAVGHRLVLADYLEQHLRRSRAAVQPRDSLWRACLLLDDPETIHKLGGQAESRGRYLLAEALYTAAAAAGDTDALTALALRRDEGGDHEGAERLASQAAARGKPDALVHLASLREVMGDQEGAERLVQQAVAAGSDSAMLALAWQWDEAGDQEGAERLLEQAAAAGNSLALIDLAERRDRAGDQEGAERMLEQAAAAGNAFAVTTLVELRERHGDQEGAERLARQAATTGDTFALLRLAERREQSGDLEGGERLLNQAAAAGNNFATRELAMRQDESGDQRGAEHLVLQAAATGNLFVLLDLVERWDRAGDHEGAERLLEQAAASGSAAALLHLAKRRDRAGDHDGAEQLLEQAAAGGETFALVVLADLRHRDGDQDGAEQVLQQALAAGEGRLALQNLAEGRDRAGDHQAAERIRRYGITTEGLPAEPAPD